MKARLIIGADHRKWSNPWLVRQPRTTPAEQRLFCFPYAGGSAQVFQGWSEWLPSSIEVVAIQAPGKGTRLLEPPCASVDVLCDQLQQALMPLLHEKPFSFFGHSNGAFIAFELACRLQNRGLPMPEQLLLSASPAPWTRQSERPFSSMSDAEFKNALKGLNGTPPAILDDQGLFELLLPGLRADFSLPENYRFRWPQKLMAETHIFYGERDEITQHQLLSWQEQIGGPVTFQKIGGGHFFIHSHAAELTASIGNRLTIHPRSSRPAEMLSVQA
ncbi:MAG TPA: thioesterase domain-containing protein [Thermoanaerobaculia bacterium]|nr:thioesterase domain-containing protein [Thermoanaerobaculia bacterium]